MASPRPIPRPVCAATAALVAALLTAACGSEVPPPPASTAGPAPPAPWFEDATDAMGLDFVHETGATGALRFPEMAGSGLALLDANEDGWLDLLLLAGAPREGEGPAPRHRLYLGSERGFQDVTPGAGLGTGHDAMGAAVGDFDNDGHEDLYLTAAGPDRLLRGHGDGTFTDVTESAGISLAAWSTSAAFCDFDRDGDLDLYVAQYVQWDPTRQCSDNTGRPDYCGPDSYPDEIDALLRNEGNGTFTDVTIAAGIDQATGSGLGVVCEDLDDDGWTDVYVANDGDPNQLWINQGDGTFLDEAVVLGAGVNAQGLHEAGMGIIAADFDNDLDYDLFLSHLRDETNTLYRNLGSGRGFQDHTNRAGLASASMPFTGFGTTAFDADHDGDLDLAIVNGRVKRGEPLTDRLGPAWNPYAEPNLFFVNEGGEFRELGEAATTFTAPIEVNRGLVVGDLDRDGDLDLVTTTTQGPARIYRNQAPQGRHWLVVDAIDPSLGRRALGARVTVSAGGQQQIRTVHGASSYLSSSDPRAHFGLDRAPATDRLVVRWPDGSEEVFAGGPADRVMRLERGQGTVP